MLIGMTKVSKSVTKAVIPAAGLGTRFLPATKATPKEMLPVVDRPAIQYVVEEAIRAGLNDVLMITGRNKRALEDHFDRVPVLESQLAEQGKDALLKAVEAMSWVNCTMCARATLKVWAMQFCAARYMWGMSPSRFCWAMT